MINVLVILVLAIISGILGRMGGAQGYDTKYRDAGCSLVAVLAITIALGWHPSFWWVYVVIFGIHWAAFTTYWDWLFGFDNLWFSGFMVGISIFPLWFIDHSWWVLIIARGLGLAVIWGLLNKFTPSRIFIWRRDISEEFLRYSFSL